MMIVEYSNDYHDNMKTVTYDTTEEIFMFVASSSSSKHFRIHRINKYDNGKLVPHEVTINRGKISLEVQVLEPATQWEPR